MVPRCAALKDALQRLGLKAGGTDAERAARLFATKGGALADVDPRLFVRGAAPPRDAAAAERAAAAARRVAALEAEVGALLGHLGEVLSATRGNAERKSTLSWQELEAERLEEEEDVPDAEEGGGGPRRPATTP